MIARVATLLVLVAASPLSASTIRITCRDGGGARLQGFGRSVAYASACDIDHAVDGICTFRLTDCESCSLRFRFGCIQACAVQSDSEAPCPSQYRHFAVVARRRGAAVRIFNDGGQRTVFRCLAARGPTPTTTTLPPSDLTGEWLISDTAVTDDCPPGIEPEIASHRQVGMLQRGAEIAVCSGAFTPASHATIDSTGFAVDTGMCCGIGGVDGVPDYVYRRLLTIALPTSDGRLSATERWELTAKGPVGPGTPVTCQRDSTSVMTRVPASCTRHEDCVRIDPCSRCIGGICRADPRCR